VVVESCCSGNVGLDLMDSGGEFAQLRFCRWFSAENARFLMDMVNEFSSKARKEGMWYTFLYQRRSGFFSALSSSTNQLMPEKTRTSPIEKSIECDRYSQRLFTFGKESGLKEGKDWWSHLFISHVDDAWSDIYRLTASSPIRNRSWFSASGLLRVMKRHRPITSASDPVKGRFSEPQDSQ
jgi:hypothetical protein